MLVGTGTRSEGSSLKSGAGESGRWFAVHCQAHREATAAENLDRQGFPVFFPRLKKTRRHARKIERIFAPLFPGYLFVRLDLFVDRWRSVNGTFGVVRLIMQGERPLPVPKGIVETLIGTCDSTGIIVLRADLELGQKVRLVDGPFAGLVGELVQMTDSERVGVLLDIMGRRASVRVSRECVVPAGSAL